MMTLEVQKTNVSPARTLKVSESRGDIERDLEREHELDRDLERDLEREVTFGGDRCGGDGSAAATNSDTSQ